MTVKVQVGPPQIAIHQGQTVLITEEDGQINWPSEKGLYFFDTRVVSSWRHLCQRRTMGTAERRRHQLLRIPHLPDQSRLCSPKTARSRRARMGLIHQPIDQRRHARGP